MNAQLSPASADAQAQERSLRAEIDANPRDAQVWLRLTQLLEQQARHGEALDVLRQALERMPGEVALYNRFANLLQGCGEFEGAVDVYRMALAIEPSPGLHNNLAVALKKLGRWQEAKDALQSALALDPAHFDALNNLGNVLALTGDRAAAIACFRQVLECNPQHAPAYSNIGNACQGLGDFDSAAQMYEYALTIDPQLAEARWNRALLWLQQGDYERGWSEYRWGVHTGDRPQRKLHCERWRGEPLQGRSVFVYAEQGLGDTLQFARLLPLLREQGARVVFECQQSLLQLIDASELADQVLAAGETPPPTDFGTSLLDLPELLHLTLDRVPAPKSYLVLDPKRRGRWQTDLGRFPGLRVGLCWEGGSAYRDNARRSCALADMAPLGRLPGVTFFNLQRGPAAAQAEQPPAGLQLQPLETEWDQFADLAAAVAQLDLVITVDTSVAHLAGALGIQTWTLLADVPDWRWLLDRADSPWYPAMRLYRQSKPGDWQSVLERVAADLGAWSPQRAEAACASVPVTEAADNGSCAAGQADEAALLLDQGMQKHVAGDLHGAATLYERVLALQADNADALRLLGTVARARGDLDRAANYIERAAAIVPDSPLIYTSLGQVYQEQHAPGLALQCFNVALHWDSGYADAWLGVGVSHQLSGDYEAAVRAYRRVLQLQPEHVRASFNLAMALQAAGQAAEAIEAFRAVLAADPNHIDARMQLGQLLTRNEQFEGAVEQFQAVLQQDPGHFNAYRLLGDVYKDQGRYQLAVDCYHQALQLQPDAMGVHNNLGNTYRAMGLPDDAERCYLKAVELAPEAPEGYNNLGTLYKDAGQLSRAQHWFEKTLEIAPDFVFAMGNLVKVYQETCCWDRYQPMLERLIAETQRLLDQQQRVSMPPFFSLSLPLSAEFQQRVARNYAQTVVLRGLAELDLAVDPKPDAQGRLRIGYVSSDFHNHATAQLMLSLFGLHDRKRFEVFAYSLGKDDGSHYRQRIVADCDRFVDVHGWHYTEIAQRVAADGIHILVDLKGYTMDIKPEVFALRPAPIQVNYLGFPGTMGASFMDYIVTDAVVTPAEDQRYFDEAFAVLPHTYQVNDHRQPIAERTPSRKECGLPEQGFVFCCFNNNYKIEPDAFGVWMHILRQVPDSVLWLLRASPEAEVNLRDAAQSHGVAPERLVFADRLPKAEHLARHRLADLFLDTFYYNAHTTASDALWAGLPVLTCPGNTFAARVGASLLHAVGLPELIAPDRESYARTAVQLAHDAQALAALRARLQDRPAGKPLFDTARFARNLEAAYLAMWHRHEQRQDPAAIHVTEPEETSMQASASAIQRDTYNELLLGCGSRHNKDIHVNERPQWSNLVTLDINPDHKPDVIWDLSRLPLPFPDNSFDEIHAYEVLEHVGTQGDYKFFFAQFSDFWRILKPGGVLIGTVPLPGSPWAWGDPSHTRVIPKESFIFLEQPQYTAQVGKTPLSDFRYLYQADFERVHVSEQGHKLAFVLQAVKPSRIAR